MTNKIDRRQLIKGATVIGGTLWALPVIETVAMPAANAGSAPPGTVLPGSLGAQYNPLVGIQIPFICVTPTLLNCFSLTPANPAGGCAVTTPTFWNVTEGALTIGIHTGYHLYSGFAVTPTSCLPAVQAPSPLVSYSELWVFSAGGGPFSAVLLIVPTI
jgi:hypothetical protein